MNFSRSLFALALFLLLLRPAAAQSAEMRGLWVVRTSLTSPAQIARVVAQAHAHHFNALFVQVRGRGAQDSVLFSYGGVTKDGTTTAYLDKVDQSGYTQDAAVPIMPWLGKRPETQSADKGKIIVSAGG